MQNSDTPLDKVGTIEDQEMFLLKNWHYATWKRMTQEYGAALDDCFNTYGDFISECGRIHHMNQQQGRYSSELMLFEVCIKLIVTKERDADWEPKSIGSQYLYLYRDVVQRDFSVQYPPTFDAKQQFNVKLQLTKERRDRINSIIEIPKQLPRDTLFKLDFDGIKYHKHYNFNAAVQISESEIAEVTKKARASDNFYHAAFDYVRPPKLTKINIDAFQRCIPPPTDASWYDRVIRCKNAIDMIVYKICNQAHGHPYYIFKNNRKACKTQEEIQTKYYQRQLPRLDQELNSLLLKLYGTTNVNQLHHDFAALCDTKELKASVKRVMATRKCKVRPTYQKVKK
jgi:hypothetical protein